MNDVITGQTLQDIKKLQGEVLNIRKAAGTTITTATGLAAFDLQAPAKNLYPVNTPIRNMVPRITGGVGTATNWKQISAIIGSGYDAMGWVPEGQRAGAMSITSAPKSASYVTIGEEEAVTFEAVNAAQTFEDIASTSVVRLLQKAMLKEENAILGGNNNAVALGVPTTPVTSASGSGATLPTLTYDVAVVALTYEGWLNRTQVAPLAAPLSQVITGQDGSTYTLKGGSSNKSAVQTQAITLGQHLFAATTPIAGAVGYAWYIGAAGASRLEVFTTIASLEFTTALAGTGQLLSAVSADNSQNTLAFNGLLYSAWQSGSGAYIKTMAQGVSGTGTPLTSSGRGSVNEIDQMLQTMWNTNQVSPTVIWVNAQELTNITTKVLSNASAPLLHYNSQVDDGPRSQYSLVANGAIEFYYNPYTVNPAGGVKIPIRIHPALPPGTMIGWCSDLPIQYQSPNVPNVAEMKIRQEYYQIDWPLVTRARQVGVYVEEVLAVYAPFALAIITNIGNG